MNDSQPSAPPPAPAPAPAPAPGVAPSGPAGWGALRAAFLTLPAALRRGLLLAAGALVVLSVALWWVNHDRIGVLEREFARRIQDGDATSKESRTLARQALDQVTALQTRIGVIESRVTESQSQQLALEQLYQELSRSRDDWALAEIEQTLAVAAQQLQLAGNVQGAIIALQNADNRLARRDRPQFIALRRVLARDLDRLKALPAADVAGSALRIDSLVAMVDNLPLLIDEKPAPRPRLDATPRDRARKEPAHPVTGSLEWLQETFRYVTAQAWDTFLQLVRVQEVDQPEALLLAPDQAFFVRENLKLRLLNARLALLARQEATYRADLLSAQEALQRYFDVRSRQTVAALALLKQVQSSTTVVELPNLSESLNAVRNFKPARER